MRELNTEGYFWLVSDPDNEVAGRLSYDEESGAVLDLIGAFSKTVDFLEFSGESVRIHGVAGGHLYTLDECSQLNKNTTYPGFVREKYRVSRVLDGGHFGDGELLKFNSLELQMDHLRAWVGKSGTQVEVTRDNASKGIERIHIAHVPLEVMTGSSCLGDLEIRFPYRFHPYDSGVTSVTQDCAFRVRFGNELTLKDIEPACYALRNLVTIGVDVPTRITHINVKSTKGKWVALYFRLGSRGAQANTNRDTHPAEMLFTFEHIGGLRGIASWLDVSERYGTVIRSLLSNWYLPGLYGDIRFLNAAIAAEALERIRTQNQNVNFRRALLNLAKRAGDTFQALVNDIESWSREVTQVRVNQVVHRGLGEDIDPLRLRDLTESLEYLVVLCLLRECGVPETTFSSIQQHGRFVRLADWLREVQ